MLIRKNKILSEAAEKKAKSDQRIYGNLVPDSKIAMRDLEIRSRNLLGKQPQHGHMEAIGYDLYCKLLEETVRK